MLDLSFLSLLIFNRFLNPISDVSTQFSKHRGRPEAGLLSTLRRRPINWRFPSKMVILGDPPKWMVSYDFYISWKFRLQWIWEMGDTVIAQKHPSGWLWSMEKHHRKWAAQMDWNLHIWGFVWEFSTPIAMVLNLISSIHYNGRKFM